jgi:sugar phosphate isomerase/epimerase
MIGLCSVTFRDKSVEEIIQLAKEENLEVIEWGSDGHVPLDDVENAKRVAELMEEAGLKTNSYGSYYRLGAFEDFAPYIEIATILGASVIRVWPGEIGSKEASAKERAKVVEDAKRISELASAQGITIGLEYHRGTLTDTPESSETLMREINSPNVQLYWQPAENLSVKERIDSLSKLAPWIKNVHVFHWEDYHNRFPLEDGFDEWKQYIEVIQDESPFEQDYLLEFVPGEDQVQGFKESAATLKQLIE